MAAKQTGRNSDQFNLRLPDGMRDRIAVEAEKAGRSMNAEIVRRLLMTLNEDYSPPVEIVSLKPIGISRSSASALLGITGETFDQLVKDGTLPQPVMIGSEQVWRTEHIEYAASGLIQYDLLGNVQWPNEK